jgi:hypothetical protein
MTLLVFRNYPETKMLYPEIRVSKTPVVSHVSFMSFLLNSFNYQL